MTCKHPNAEHALSHDWIYRCPEFPSGCGLEGAGHSPEAAERSFWINDKFYKGLPLSAMEENVRAFTAFPWGTAAGCASRVVQVVRFPAG